ncbi:TPA: hypothetical protein ACFP4Y_001354, partial [Neisseria bacilliformis]
QQGGEEAFHVCPFGLVGFSDGLDGKPRRGRLKKRDDTPFAVRNESVRAAADCTADGRRQI